MSIANEISRISDAKAAIKVAINAKGGVLTTEKIGAYAAAIDALLPEDYGNRVRFIDYDGTVLKTMYVAFGEGATPPSTPSHAGLVFQGWNCDYSNIVSDLDVGAVFTTSSGKAEFDVRMEVRTGYTVVFCPNIINGTLTVDWGDGSTDTVAGTGRQEVSYTYSEYGEYTVKFSMSTGGSWQIPSYFCTGSSRESFYLIFARITGVQAIEQNAFYYCRGLKYVTLSRDVGSIGNSAFYSCRGILSIVFPDSMTSVGQYALYECFAMSRVVFPDSITIIPQYICQSCRSIDAVIIPNAIVEISNYAFNSCFGAKVASFPPSLRTIGSGCFNRNYSLSELKFSIGITTIGDEAFSECYGLKTVVLPDSITSLGAYTFNYCYGLQSVNIPASITRIPDHFCRECYALEKVVISSAITSIGTDAFRNCFHLNEISIPKFVTSISDGAFYSCYAMKNYYLSRNTPPTLGGTGAFYNIPGCCIIWVPASADRTVLTAYKTASNWSYYADYMKEME